MGALNKQTLFKYIALYISNNCAQIWTYLITGVFMTNNSNFVGLFFCKSVKQQFHSLKSSNSFKIYFKSNFKTNIYYITKYNIKIIY